MPKGNQPQEVLADRMAAIELAMIRRQRTTRIMAEFAREWGISERQVLRYMQKVRERWRAEADADPNRRERERDHMRMSLNDLYSQAMTRTELVRDAKGNPVPQVDKSGKVKRDNAGNVVMQTVRSPDVRTAASVARTIIELDALQAPPPKGPPIDLNLQGKLDHGVSAADRSTLEAFLRGLPRPVIASPPPLPGSNGTHRSD